MPGLQVGKLVGAVEKAVKIAPKGSMEASLLDDACNAFSKLVKKTEGGNPYRLDIKQGSQRFDLNEVERLRRELKIGNPLTKDEFQYFSDVSFEKFREAIKDIKGLDISKLTKNQLRCMPDKLKHLLGIK